MAYNLTRAEVTALIDIVEETTSSNDRTAEESAALLKLHQIKQAIETVAKRKRQQAVENTHE